MALATEAADGFLTQEEKQRQRQAMQQREAEAAKARRTRGSEDEEDSEDEGDEDDEDGAPAPGGRRGLRSGQQVQQNVVTKNLNKAVRKTEEVGWPYPSIGLT